VHVEDHLEFNFHFLFAPKHAFQYTTVLVKFSLRYTFPAFFLQKYKNFILPFQIPFNLQSLHMFGLISEKNASI